MLRAERLSAKHAVHGFVSTNADLDSWLWNAALTADRAGTARVYVWADEDERVAAYFAIAPHTIRRDDVPSTVGRGAPVTIPAFLLARLALARSMQGRGMGGELLVAALGTTLDAVRLGGGRVIVVDAIDAKARTFYEHYGFRAVEPVGGRLVMKASTAAASLGVEWV